MHIRNEIPVKPSHFISFPWQHCGLILLHGDLMLVTLHAQEPQQTLAERALYVHPEGCPAHQSVKAAIRITWDATLHVGEEVIRLSSEAPLE